MRYLKLTSAKNPYTDFIELNDFNGFLCTSFQTIGISRKLEFLSIQNTQFSVDNQTNFKKYTLNIEILSKYSDYEAKHRQLINFLDRNKKVGFRLYFKPYDGMDLRYCLCDIESSQRTEKMQPVVLVFVQKSLWFGEEKIVSTAQTVGDDEGLFAFVNNNGYYCASFSQDKNINGYYCMKFYDGISTEAIIVNNSYNEIPLNIKIYGECVNPVVSLFEKSSNKPIRSLQIFANIDQDYYIEINAKIGENGVWYVNGKTGEKIDYTESVNYEYGSPYLYVDNGEYVLRVTDSGNNACLTNVFLQEEYSE